MAPIGIVKVDLSIGLEANNISSGIAYNSSLEHASACYESYRWICISVFTRMERSFSSDESKVRLKFNNQISRFPDPRRTASAKPI